MKLALGLYALLLQFAWVATGLNVLNITAECSQDRLFTVDIVQQHIDRLLCLDGDPVPSAIFTPSLENLFLQSAVLPARAGGLPAVVSAHLGAGFYVISEGLFQFAFVTYERCQRGNSLSNSAASGCNGAADRLFRGGIVIDMPTGFFLTDGVKWVVDFAAANNITVTDVVLSHNHFDHIGFLFELLTALPSIDTVTASKATADTIDRYVDTTYSNARMTQIFKANNAARAASRPNNVFSGDSYVLKRGNQTLSLRLPPNGPGHCEGNVLIWHNASKTLVHIDSVFAKWSPLFNFAIAADLPSLFALFDTFREYDYEHVVAGHLTHIATPSDVALAEEYYVDILDAAYRAYLPRLDPSSPDSVGAIGAFRTFSFVPGNVNSGNNWVTVQLFFRNIAMECAKLVDSPSRNLSGKVWKNLLAGHRQVVFQHCFTAMFKIRTESPGIYLA